MPGSLCLLGSRPGAFRPITHQDRLEYFARYSSVSLGRVKNLYLDWAKLKGPMSPECQQLNRLFSQCVDGNRIKIPVILEDPPKKNPDMDDFILDVLHRASSSRIQLMPYLSSSAFKWHIAGC